MDLVQFHDILLAKDKGTGTACGAFWPSLLQWPILPGSYWSCGTSFNLGWSPVPGLWPLVGRFLHTMSSLSYPQATVRPHPSVLPWPVMSEAPKWRARSMVSESSLFPICSCYCWHSGLYVGLSAQGPMRRKAKPLCFHPVLSLLLPMVLQAPRGRAISIDAISLFLAQCLAFYSLEADSRVQGGQNGLMIGDGTLGVSPKYYCIHTYIIL